MQIIVRTDAGEIDVDVRQERPDADIADLIEALAPGAGAHGAGLEVDGRPVDSDLGFDEAGLVHGSVVAVVAAAPGRMQQRSPSEPADPSPLELVVVGGRSAGGRAELAAGVTMGRDPEAELTIEDMTVSLRHATARASDDGVVVEDLRSHNGVRCNGQPVWEPTVIGEGDLVELGATAVQVRPVIRIDRPIGVDPVRAGSAGSVAFNRPPRQALPEGPGPIEVPAAPLEHQRGRTASVVTLIGPILMGIVMVKLLGNIRFALFALMSPVMFFSNMFAERRRAKKENKNSARRFKQELTEFGDLLADAVGLERLRMAALLPDLAEVLRRVTLPSTRLWERRSSDSDYLRLRIGRGPQPWQPPVDTKAAAAHEDLEDAVTEASVIPNCAIDLELGAGGVVGLVGDRGSALALARALVCQATVHHGPADLPVTVLTDRMRAPDWDWAKWLPHVRSGDGGARRLTTDAEVSTELMQALLDAVTSDDGSFSGLTLGNDKGPVGPAMLVVVDDETLTTGRRAPTRAVLRGGAGPVAGIVIAPTADQLPAVCTTVVVLRDDLGDAEVHRPQRAQVIGDVVIDGLDESTARHCAASLARYEDPELDLVGAGIPTAVRLLPLLGMERIDGAQVAETWAAAGIDPAPVAPIGIGEDGIVELNMVTDGPHGLVGGTTGSGKSEFLRSLVAGMAARVSPENLVFVLVDYKGGSAFDECSRLPHTVGMVTDLDEHLGERALKSLEAELHHRERQLREAGATDLPEYLHMGAPLGPMPRLLLVVDEFATMAAELPDFMGALVGIAQRGRSLGVHMLLATQRPSGAVNANIKANTNMRIALRVQDSGDSMDVIDRKDAAEISRSTPGRAYVRLGPTDVIPVQTALSTAPPPSDVAAAVSVARFRFGPRPSVPRAAVATGDDQPSELVMLVDACVEAFAASGAAPPRRPWLPMLAEELDLATVVEHPDADPGVVALGVADDPDTQTQAPMGWRPDDGHLGLLGMVGSGTSTAAVTAALAWAHACSADELHVYGIDYGGGALADLAGLPHSGAVIAAADREKQVRLVRYLRSEIDRRRAMDPSTRAAEPRLLLVLDGAAAFMADYEGLDGQETLDAFKRVMSDGAGVRIHVVLTATRPMEVPMRIMASVTQRLMFKHADPGDFSAIGVRSKGLPAFVPGRAIHGESQLVMQAGRAADPTAAVRRLAARGLAQHRPPKTIRSMPNEVLLSDVAGGAEAGGVPLLPIGIEGDEMETLRMPVYPGEHVFVGGTARSGVSTTLEMLAQMFRDVDPDSLIVAVADPRSPLNRNEGLFDACGTLDGLDAVLRHAETDTGRSWIVVVDDAHTIEDPGLLEPLVKAGDHVRLVVGGRSDQLQGSFSHWTRAVRRSGRGILLQPRLDADGDLLGVRLPRRISVPMVPGRGFLVADGESTLVQVAGADLAA